MSHPNFGSPTPEAPRPFKRSYPQGVILDTLRAAFRRGRSYSGRALREAKFQGERALRAAKWRGQELLRRGKRHPRVFALGGGALALTLVGAIALSATGPGRSLCPSPKHGKAPAFLVLMEPVAPATAGSAIDVRYDVCGLASGAAYSGRFRLISQKPVAKKAPKPKAVVVTFKGKVDGPAERLKQEVKLGPAKPGPYALELSVTDKQGRERKRVQKIQITAR